jgi:polyprenyl-phospho-N-acetylgalactosaminyl synthase
MPVFIIIPVYNEGAPLFAVIKDLKTHGFHNIILVDDGSNPPLRYPATDSGTFIVRHPVNMGQGAALETGMKLAIKKAADIVVHFDADGQHSAADIYNLTAPLFQNRADIVLGSRFMEKSNTNISFFRKILVHGARYFNKCMTGLLLTDAHNGLRALNKKAISKMNFSQNRMAHATEILTIIKKNNLKWEEVPVSVWYTAYSKTKGQKPFQIINIFFDILLKKLKP